MSARTFAEWQAYASLEPFGPPAEFWRAGMIAAVLASIHRKKNQAPFKPEDFMPKTMVEQEPVRLNDEETAHLLVENFRAYAEAQKVTGQ